MCQLGFPPLDSPLAKLSIHTASSIVHRYETRNVSMIPYSQVIQSCPPNYWRHLCQRKNRNTSLSFANQLPLGNGYLAGAVLGTDFGNVMFKTPPFIDPLNMYPHSESVMRIFRNSAFDVIAQSLITSQNSPLPLADPITFFTGSGSLVGPPISGNIYRATGEYSVVGICNSPSKSTG
jgi:hypothetical protein